MNLRLGIACVIALGSLCVADGTARADSPITAITDDDIQLNIDEGFFDPDCEFYRASVEFLARSYNNRQFSPVSRDGFDAIEMMDNYTIQLNEEIMAEDFGVQSAAMTEEAKALLLGWLHTCGL